MVSKYTSADIIDLTQQGEGAELEFKRDDVRPETIAKTIVAFANLRGGKILLGIEDNGDISGLTKNNTKEWVMDTVIARYVKPYIEVTVDVFEFYSSKRVAVIEVPQGVATPYVLAHNDREDIYIRSGATSPLAQREQVARLWQRSGSLHSEQFPIHGTGIENLDQRRVEEYFFKKLKFSKENDNLDTLLKSYDFLVESGHKHNLSIFAFALFGKNILPKLPQSGIRFTVYNGTDKDYSPTFDEQINAPMVEYKGELNHQILEPAIHHHPFFQSYLSEEKIIEGTRKRIWQYPPKALRELITNALVHRDWTKNNYVRVVAYANRLEIISPGALHNGMSIDKMKQGVTESRNPRMTRIMRDYGYVEQQGMGIRRTVIPQMLKQNGSEPEFIADEDKFTVILYR